VLVAVDGEGQVRHGDDTDGRGNLEVAQDDELLVAEGCLVLVIASNVGAFARGESTQRLQHAVHTERVAGDGSDVVEDGHELGARVDEHHAHARKLDNSNGPMSFSFCSRDKKSQTSL